MTIPFTKGWFKKKNLTSVKLYECCEWLWSSDCASPEFSLLLRCALYLLMFIRVLDIDQNKNKPLDIVVGIAD